jgi:TRAP-type uncharacterized transport system fused permease subunit
MIGLFTITGFINRMGAMIIDLGAANILGVILMAYVFGWLAGAGLPPTATYIIGAIVIVRPMQELGINPWIAHFFVFLLSVWGELSPPTSLTAAVSARIAEASFMRTMYEALRICAPITLMTFAIFTRSEIVVSPGWPQVLATALVFIGTCGIAFSMFGRILANQVVDIPLRIGLALLSFVVLFHPDDRFAMALAPLALAATLFGIFRLRQIADPPALQEPAQPVAATSAAAAGLAHQE